MKKKFLFLTAIILFFIVAILYQFFQAKDINLSPPAQKVMLVEIEYNYGQYKVGKIWVKPADYFPFEGESDYKLKLYDSQGNLVGNEVKFLPPGDTIVEGNEEGIGGFILPPTEEKFVIIAPYYENALTLQLEKNVQESPVVLAMRSLGDTANVCGDGTCQEFENYKLCPEDCQSGGTDGFCNDVQDGMCDADCLAIAPEDEPFSLDEDCAPPDIEDLKCDGNTICYNSNVYGCAYDREMKKRVFKVESCIGEGERCEDNKCIRNNVIIDDNICYSNRDCVVNGEQWTCECYQCKKLAVNPFGEDLRRCCYVING